MNVQYAIQRDKVFVIEVNPRASRTVPYVSKATGVPLAKIAARLMTGRKLREFLPENIERATDLATGDCYYVKSPVFPWGKFPGVDTVLGPEMKSTGEVMGVADNFGEAFAKAQVAAGQKLPTSGTVFISVNDRDKPHAASLAKRFVDLGFKLVATHGTADVIEEAGLKVERVFKVKEGRPNVVDLIKGERIQLIINTPQGAEPWFDEKAIRRAAITSQDPDHHHAFRGARSRRGHRRAADGQDHGLRAAGAASRAQAGLVGSRLANGLVQWILPNNYNRIYLAGFELQTFERYPKLIGVTKGNCVALLVPGVEWVADHGHPGMAHGRSPRRSHRSRRPEGLPGEVGDRGSNGGTDRRVRGVPGRTHRLASSYGLGLGRVTIVFP